jgi:2'-5' RNA ligase superfamily
MSRTALIIEVPEAEAAVRDIRLQHDSSAAHGVPAHVTVLFPFADSREIEHEPLAELFKAHPRFDFVLDRVERWSDGIVWLHPEPSRPFEQLTAAVWRRWPDYPPYEGSIDVVIPHLTISETPIEVDIELPIRSCASAVTLIEESPDGNWEPRRAFPLG